MHALPTLPRPGLLAAAAAIALALALLLAAAPDLASLDLSLGGGSAAPEASATIPAGTPTWVENPVAPPLVSSS